MERSPLSPSEQNWVATNLEIAAELARAYTGNTEKPPALQRLDATWMAWHDDPNQSKTDANTVVNALGIALGSHLIDALGLGWMVITDQYGTELAVYGKQNDVTFFPTNMVGKRVAENQPIFTRLHAFAVSSVTELRAKNRN